MKPMIRTITLTALLLAAPALRAQAPATPEVAETPASQRALELAALINSGDRVASRAYVAQTFAPSFLERWSVDDHVGFLSDVHDRTQGLSEVVVVEADDSSAVVRLRQRLLGEVSLFEVRVEAAAPHRITGMRPPRGLPAAERERAAPAASDAELRVKLDSIVTELVSGAGFSGVVLVARGGEPVFAKAYGYASHEFEVPNTLDTKFSLGSINKQFTTVAALRLIEAGQLGFDDTVGERLPGVLPAAADAITMRQLLTHTSGLGDFLFTPDMWELNRARFRDVADYLPRLADDELRFPPGTSWGYSNTGFLLLGAIIEKVTGEDYYDHVRRTIFEPLGMRDTDSYLLDRVVPNLANGYEREYADEGTRWRNVHYDQVVRGTPAGGGYSTAGDMAKFVEALRSGRLLSAELTRAMLTAKPELGSRDYGYGTQVFAGGAWVGHTGGGPGTAAYVGFERDGDLTIIALSNMNRGGSLVARKAIELLGKS